MSNLVKLAGDVLSVDKDECKFRTIAYTNKNDEVQSWPQIHTVMLNGAKVTEGLKYELVGRLDVFNKITKVSADPKAWKKLKKNAEYLNIVEIIGRLAGEFKFFPRDTIAKKPPMAGFLVAVKDMKSEVEKLFKGVCFDSMAITWDRMITPNSSITLKGRIRHREYQEDGQTKSMLEVVGNKALSELRPAEVKDEFDGYVASDF